MLNKEPVLPDFLVQGQLGFEDLRQVPAPDVEEDEEPQAQVEARAEDDKEGPSILWPSRRSRAVIVYLRRRRAGDQRAPTLEVAPYRQQPLGLASERR